MSTTMAGVEIRPIKRRFGAEITGLDLSRELPEAEFRRIEQAWFDASFLVFRDLVMTPGQHIAFTRRFGPLHIMTPLHYNHPQHAEVLVLTNLEDGGKPLGIRRAGMGWHSDGEDKRCMLHCATPFDEAHYTRFMHRTTLEGEVPA